MQRSFTKKQTLCSGTRRQNMPRTERMWQMRTSTRRSLMDAPNAEEHTNVYVRHGALPADFVREGVDPTVSVPENASLIAGLFLYWSKGGSVKPCAATLRSTDTAVLQFYPHLRRL